MRFYAEFSKSAPDELCLDAALVTAPSGERHFSISACYAGPIEEGERAVKSLREYGAPVEDRIAPIPYLQIQSAGDSIFPRGRRYYWKAQFLRELTDAAIDTLLAAYATAPSVEAHSSCSSRLAARSPACRNQQRPTLTGMRSTTAFRSPSGTIRLTTNRTSSGARHFWNAMRPFSTGGVYANNLGDEGEDRVQAAYGENYPRLVALKNKYDPMNVFCLNQNIRPTV